MRLLENDGERDRYRARLVIDYIQIFSNDVKCYEWNNFILNPLALSIRCYK